MVQLLDQTITCIKEGYAQCIHKHMNVAAEEENLLNTENSCSSPSISRNFFSASYIHFLYKYVAVDVPYRMYM